jgi:hypothetical protein
MPEDRFVAGELASAPSEINGKRAPVVSSRTTTPIIVIDRTDALGCLNRSNDQPGLDSKDAHTLHITQRGAEIRTRSSASPIASP